jgi:hypothetical protein
MMAILANDAVAIGRVVLRGPGSTASVRAQLAACPTPSVRPWVFVRRLTLATRGGSVAPEFTEALARLASHDAGSDVVVFPDFAALATSLARDLLAGVAATRWYWRRLGVLAGRSTAEVAVGLLAEQPLETWAVLEQWHDEGLLVPIWRQLTAETAAVLLGGVGWATRTTLPDTIAAQAVSPLPVRLEPAVAFWRDAVSQAAASQAAIHAAAVLSLLRWDPVGLVLPTAAAGAAALANAWRLSLAAPVAQSAEVGARLSPPRVRSEPNELTDRHRHTGGDLDAAQSVASPTVTTGEAAGTAQSAETASSVAVDAAGVRPISHLSHAREFSTQVGGTLFLINVLNGLEVMQRLLDWRDGKPPSGWQLMHDLARVLDAPEDDELITFLAEQMGEPLPIAPFIAELAAAAADIYEPFDVWHAFLCQPGLLRATAGHLDLDLHSMTIDIRIRRSGLDLDPAWVPWLGRVVRFHYPRLPQRPAH